MALTTVYERSTDLVERRVLRESLLVPIRGDLADLEAIFALNRVAQHIWTQIDGQRDLAAIRDGVVATFEVEEAQARADLEEFIAQLLDARLIAEVS